MLEIPRITAPLLLLALAVAAAPPAAGQQVLRGLGEEVAPAAATADPTAVLVIDGVEIPAEDYARWLIEEVGPPFVKEFAVGWEIGQLAEQRGLAADEAQVTAALDEEIWVRVQGAFRGDRDEWVHELERLGRSVAGHRRQRSTELQTWLDSQNLAAQGRVVPEDKILRDWVLQHGPRGRAFELDMLKVQIVVQMPADKPSREAFERAREDAREAGLRRALQARERLAEGADFAELVREYCEDPELLATGGHVERFRQYGWPSGFVDALFELERGAVSEPLSANGGWWIVRVRDWTDTPLESVRAQLTQQLIERGPEQDEIGRVWDEVSSSIQIEIQPGMYAADVPDDGEGPGPTALTVNGTPIPRKVLARWLLHTRGEASWGHFTEEWLLLRKAAELGVSVAQDELDAHLEDYFQRVLDESYKGDRGVWRTYQEAAGNDPDAWLRQLRRRRRLALLGEKVLMAQREITPEMVLQTYHRRYGEVGRRVQARVLLLEIATPALEEGLSKSEVDERLQAAAQARRRDAEELAARARAGEDFATLVRQYSDDRISRELGGKLEGGFRPDGWSSEVSGAVMSLPRGGISEAVQEGRFWAVFEVIDFEEVSFESVREEIERDLRERRPAQIEIAAYRNELLGLAQVELLPGLRE